MLVYTNASLENWKFQGYIYVIQMSLSYNILTIKNYKYAKKYRHELQLSFLDKNTKFSENLTICLELCGQFSPRAFKITFSSRH